MKTTVQHVLAAHTPTAMCSLIQRKARIGPVNDPLEREAEEIADAVVAGLPVGTVKGTTAAVTPQRMCAECEARERPLQRKSAQSAQTEHGGAAELAVRAVSQGGAPLTATERAYFEPRFGRDFSKVRIHSSGPATRAANSINARAFTYTSR